MSKVLLVDGNALGYAAQMATKLTCSGKQTQAIFGMIKSIYKLRVAYRSYEILCLWDGRAQWRFNLHPEYKSKRAQSADQRAMRESYAEQKPLIEAALRHLGVRQVTCFSTEADDLAGYFVNKLSAKPGAKIGLITGDEDWMQLVRPNVWWNDPRNDSKFTDHKNFYERTGCRTPFEFLEAKVLQGDSSDNIGGVGGLGEKGAPEFIAEFGSVRRFWEQCNSGVFVPKAKAHRNLWKGESPHTKQEWEAGLEIPADLEPKAATKLRKAHMDAWPGQGRAIYKRNLQLMQLLRVDPPKKEDMKVDLGKFDKEAFANICEEYAFVSILRNLDEFTSSFQQ